tara:strand:- start:249 stop:566 length:318 start_codon:yes stop_codon:yes gene_type:complete
MLNKKIIFIFATTFLFTSCAGTWNSVKRGLTGEKAKSTDEFLVKKKDPLILPPNYDSLPSPDDRTIAKEEISIFKKSSTETSAAEDTSSSTKSVEQSIIQRIKKN